MDRAHYLNRQGSEAETEGNPYGFIAAHQSNPTEQAQQAIWQDFQRAYQEEGTMDSSKQ